MFVLPFIVALALAAATAFFLAVTVTRRMQLLVVVSIVAAIPIGMAWRAGFYGLDELVERGVPLAPDNVLWFDRNAGALVMLALVAAGVLGAFAAKVQARFGRGRKASPRFVPNSTTPAYTPSWAAEAQTPGAVNYANAAAGGGRAGYKPHTTFVSPERS